MHVRQAELSEAAMVSDVLREAAAWLAETGRPMWRDSELIPERLAADVSAGLFFVAVDGDAVIGTIRFQLEDERFWPDLPGDDAAYLHRLAIRRSHAGTGVSTRLLQWGADRARHLGRRYLRLDCEASRLPLRALYEGFGFRHHSDRQVGPYFVARYEMRVTP